MRLARAVRVMFDQAGLPVLRVTMSPNHSTIHVLRPGLFTTIPDLGRRGYQRFGVSVSGAMDPWALTVGNRLVSNPDRAAAWKLRCKALNSSSSTVCPSRSQEPTSHRHAMATHSPCGPS